MPFKLGTLNIKEVRVGVSASKVKLQTIEVLPKTINQSITATDDYFAIQRVNISGEPNLLPQNIRQGVSIFGVDGTFGGAELMLQDRTIKPTYKQQKIIATKGYDALSSVTIQAIPSNYIDTNNANATAIDILEGKTAFVKGEPIVGTLKVQNVIVSEEEPKEDIGEDGDVYLIIG